MRIRATVYPKYATIAAIRRTSGDARRSRNCAKFKFCTPAARAAQPGARRGACNTRRRAQTAVGYYTKLKFCVNAVCGARSSPPQQRLCSEPGGRHRAAARRDARRCRCAARRSPAQSAFCPVPRGALLGAGGPRGGACAGARSKPQPCDLSRLAGARALGAGRCRQLPVCG